MESPCLRPAESAGLPATTTITRAKGGPTASRGLASLLQNSDELCQGMTWCLCLPPVTLHGGLPGLTVETVQTCLYPPQQRGQVVPLLNIVEEFKSPFKEQGYCHVSRVTLHRMLCLACLTWYTSMSDLGKPSPSTSGSSIPAEAMVTH